jgi:hypothetical protein
MFSRSRAIGALVALMLAALLLLPSGCTKRVPVATPVSGRVGGGKEFVHTSDGTEYRFRWAEVEDSTLTGHYRVEQEVSRDGYVEVVEADRTIPLHLSKVLRIEKKRFDLEKSLFLAGGAAVVGYFIQTLLPEDTPTGEPGNGGKPGTGGLSPSTTR